MYAADVDLFKLGCDVAIVGGGAAGLAAAIFVRRDHPHARVVILDGAARPGAKILVSGGTRCNVTNTVVTEQDFWGGKRHIIRRVLRAFPVGETVRFFSELGVALHEETGGKLFPDSNRARDVLDALLRAVDESGAQLAARTRVHGIRVANGGFLLETSAGEIPARAAIVATGGRSLPKSGSDGAGYDIARSLGHGLIAQTPALAPLFVDGSDTHGVHAALSGTAVDAELAIWVDGAVATRLAGALLFTHFGVSGPLALDASRHWARARLEQRNVAVTVNFYPGDAFDTVDARWVAATRDRPRATLRSTLAADLPDKVALSILGVLELPSDRVLSTLTRDDRRRIVHALVAWPLPVLETRGYNYAEVTAGGVDLNEIDPSTMQSRVCPGLFLIGEILDVDGRIGGFNFQWAWSSARVAARGVGAVLGDGAANPDRA